MSSPAYEALRNDPAICQRIDGGIEQNRKSNVVLRAEDAAIVNEFTPRSSRFTAASKRRIGLCQMMNST